MFECTDDTDDTDDLWDSDEAWAIYDSADNDFVEDEDFYDDCFGEDDY